MNAPADSAHAPGSRRLRFELVFASVWLAFGFLVLPALIYVVGASLLGPYEPNAGAGAFYADFYRDLAEPIGRAWLLALGPMLLVYLVRLIFLGVPRRKPDEALAAEHNVAPPAQSREHARVEPRVTLD